MKIKVRLHPTKDFDLLALKGARDFPFPAFFRMAILRYIREGKTGFIPLPDPTIQQDSSPFPEVVIFLPDDPDVTSFFECLPNGQRGNVAKNILRVCLQGLFLPNEPKRVPDKTAMHDPIEESPAAPQKKNISKKKEPREIKNYPSSATKKPIPESKSVLSPTNRPAEPDKSDEKDTIDNAFSIEPELF